MEIFQLMHDFYLEGKFTDLTIVTGQDQLFCHSLILVSAVPGLRDILRDQSESQDDRTTLVFPDIPGPVLKSVISDIYQSLVQVNKLNVLLSFISIVGPKIERKLVKLHICLKSV